MRALSPAFTLLACTLLALNLLASLPASAGPAPAAGPQFSRAFLDNRTHELWALFTPSLRQAFQSEAGFAAFRDHALSTLGTERKTYSEKDVAGSGDTRIDTRLSAFTRTTLPVEMVWVYRADGSAISSFLIKTTSSADAAPTEYTDYRTHARLQLPFEGAWTVVWGGRTVEENYHAFDLVQRFANDILIVKNGSTHSGNGKANSDYYAFGKTIEAPASGTVVEAVDGIADNRPGTANPAAPRGNHVLIALGAGEYALLAHLKNGSVRVKAGDPVQAGEPIGLCGNSGNSSAPHLHFQLQNAADSVQAEGLPARFEDVLINDRPVSRAELTRGDVIAKPETLR